MGMLWDLPPIRISGDGPMIPPPAFRVLQVFTVISHGQCQLLRHQPLIHQVQSKLVRHFAHNQSGLGKGIRLLQHLAGAEAVELRFVSLDVRNGAGLPAPGMIDQQLRIDPKELVVTMSSASNLFPLATKW